MQFSVITADDTETAYEGLCEVEDNGVPKITPDDQDSPIIRLSAAFWRQIKEPRGEVGFAFYAAER
ncbi:MAG TPA: hypothetical protein VI094_05400 [Propionibacteriaceae bacterium]